MKNREKKNRKVLPYVGLVLRIIVGIFAIGISVIFFIEMTENATTLYPYFLCSLIPILAIAIVGGDVYMRYKLDIKPLRKKKKEQDGNPLEFK